MRSLDAGRLSEACGQCSLGYKWKKRQVTPEWWLNFNPRMGLWIGGERNQKPKEAHTWPHLFNVHRGKFYIPYQIFMENGVLPQPLGTLIWFSHHFFASTFQKVVLPRWVDERATQGVQNCPLESSMALQGRKMGEELLLVQPLLQERGLILVLTSQVPQPWLPNWVWEPDLVVTRQMNDSSILHLVWGFETEDEKNMYRSALSKGGLMFGSQNNLSYLSSAAATTQDSTSSSTLKPGWIGLDLLANVP